MKAGQPVTLIVPTNAMAAMSGAYKAEKSASELRLYYQDGTTETVPLDALAKMPLDWANWFSIVSSVQSLRPRTSTAQVWILDQKPLAPSA